MGLIPHRVRAVLSLTTTIYTLSLLASSATIRTAVLNVFSARAHPFRLAALLITVLLNLKTIPLAWHVRVFGTMFYQLYRQPSPIPARALFRPIVTRGCFTSLLECDYNLHKSNSTYFADLDVARSALVCALLRNGIRQRGTRFPRSGATSGDGVKPPSVSAQSTNGNDSKGAIATAAEAVSATTTTLRPPPSSSASTSGTASPQPDVPTTDFPTLEALAKSNGPFTIALGAVSTHFKREIKPYEPYEIWTRVLAWDRKWMYLVSHVVKAGAVRAEDVSAWGLQPWRDDGAAPSLLGRLFSARRGRKPEANGVAKEDAAAQEQERRTHWQKAIFASSISKYVVKKGRITVPMDEVLINNHLIPGRMDEVEEDDDGLPAWNWANIEAERQRGLQLAEKFGALDALAEEFPGLASSSAVSGKDEGLVVLGEYPDLVW